MVKVWYKYGISMLLVWYKYSINMVLIWYKYGIIICINTGTLHIGHQWCPAIIPQLPFNTFPDL